MSRVKVISTIDAHTAGGPTRVIIDGTPVLSGETVAEKMSDFRTNHDSVRKLLMREPRGHKGMYGAVITEATGPEADIGAFFFTSSGYLPACVHSSMGVTRVAVETGMISRRIGRPIRMEIPTGVISLRPTYTEGELRSVAIQTPPAFVHTHVVDLDLGARGSIRASIVFCGSSLTWSTSTRSASSRRTAARTLVQRTFKI